MPTPTIPMTKVEKSSNVQAFGYDPATRTLAVQFHGSGEYRFADVPQDVADGLAAAESKGSFFARNVKGKFQAPASEEA